MAYKLTLTIGERKAIDWVGHRYAHGDNLYDVLTSADWDIDAVSSEQEDWGWMADCDITFTLSEPLAWEIQEIREESNCLWDCFADELVAKMEALCKSIV